MNPLEATKFCVQDEDPAAFAALYNDILAREVVDIDDPTPLDEFGVREVVKLLWSMRRMGEDPQKVMEEAYREGHFTRRRTEEAEFSHREGVVVRCISQIRAIRSIVSELKSDVARETGESRPLRVVK